MRRIGTVSNEQQAQSLRDYLFTRDIEVQVDEGDDGWNVWVLDEDQLDTARQELEEFQTDPQAQKYAAASAQANARRQARLDEELKARKRHVNMRERWERPIFLRIPVTFALIIASVGVTIATRFGSNHELTNQFYIEHVDYAAGLYNTTLPDVRSGQVWRLVTPIFLHMNWMHIIFNMYWLYLLGGMIESARGKWRFLSTVLIIAVASNLVQFWGPAFRLAEWSQLFDEPEKYFSYGPTFGGMSGVIYGLFGYLWMKSRFAPEEGFFVPKQTVVLFIVWAFLCLSGLVGPVANTAHFVGLFTGMAIALAPVLIRNFRG